MISVIVPVYNVKEYLEKCILSILSQTYTELEILLIDDGSTDGSGDVCERYAKKDDRIRVYHTENHGLSAARNYGLDRAQGQYIGFVDSDDWIEPDMYERLLKIAKKTGADIVTCNFFMEYKHKTEKFSGPAKPFVVCGDDILHTYLFRQGACQDSWNNLFNADLFQNVRYPEGRSFEDYTIKPPLIKNAKKMVYTPACLLHYRNRKNSLSNVHTLKSNIDYWVTFKERFDLLSPLSKEYYRLSLSQAMASIGRMWRWTGSYSGKEKLQAKFWIKEMQQFNNAHYKEIMKDPAYSLHTKLIGLCVKYKSALLYWLLYRFNYLYRKLRINTKDYFE